MNLRQAAGVIRGTSGLNVLAGLWLIIAPFVLGYSDIEPALWNDVVCGVLIAALAAVRVITPTASPGFSWTNLGIGIWLIIAPYALDYDAAAGPVGPTPPVGAAGAVPAPVEANDAFWNDVIVGLVVVALGAWSAITGRGASRAPARS